MKRYIVLFILALSSPLSFANIQFTADKINNIALNKRLDNHPQWLKLLHYQDGFSEIGSSTFFLADIGNTNPKQELKSTLEGFFSPSLNDNNQHPQCRFPARRLWLKSQLGTELSIPDIHCPDLIQWQTDRPTTSMSLVFVTGYLGNPASFFGHLLMKFNLEPNTDYGDSPLLDNSYNFGAHSGPQDNPLKYVTYGLMGGYKASFTEQAFYAHEFEYAENEQRELWEYELNLSQQEVALLSAHLWELKGKKFTYYFVNGNCATQMAKFVSIVLDVPILVPNQPWDMPLDIFKSITNIEHQGQPLVKEIHKRESKFTRIHNKYINLSSTERTIAKNILADHSVLDAHEFNELTIDRKAKILDLLFDYYELTISDRDASEGDIAQAKHKKRALLLKRLSFPATELKWDEIKSSPPHLAQNPQKVAISLGDNSKLGTVGSLQLRFAYYDFLALETARFKNSNASFFDVEVKFNQDKIWLQKFDIFNVATLNTLQVDLFENDRFAWSTKLTLEQKDLSCNRCEKVRWYGSMGKAAHIWEDIAVYAMPELMADISNIHGSTMGISLGVLYTANSLWKTHFNITPRTTIGQFDQQELIVNWENRFGNASNWDVRLNMAYSNAYDVSLSYAKYF